MTFAPQSHGQHGHEGDGGCVCQGLTGAASTGSLDSIENANAVRRQLVERLNFPPTLTFASGISGSAKVASLPPSWRMRFLLTSRS